MQSDPTVLQRYRSLDEFLRLHSLKGAQMLPRPHEGWRLLQQPVLGCINGLGHKFLGLAMATNGIIVAIETSANHIIFGHLEWFMKDDPDEPTDLDNLLAESNAKRRKMQCVDAFAELFE